ncbi:TIGR02281 family clan AA aspartic protease [Methylobacterium sp. J-068]|uniref:retropepsin-like aspartic protease family protein n=1 Tax=Methylobacterium sp. J-068 TaxID=2836649 RepID=UPI001FBA5E31|nr:TIGR02281 family clan AA aspartic protease [Methylobacterium sp. J-068]MCJ2035066.1 TIGR02281 family clan AA aspartic protease [Methylobacterium sp. J-068]
MTRPIVWAFGITAVAAIWAVGLAERFDRSALTSAAVGVPPADARSAGAPFRPNTETLFADSQGHFATEAVIDGRRLRMLVDTGATTCAFTYEDAERAGLSVSERDFRLPVQTANGTVYAARVRISAMRVGNIVVQGVDGMVMPRGRLSTSLLGMSFLKRLNEFSMNGGRLTLRG